MAKRRKTENDRPAATPLVSSNAAVNGLPVDKRPRKPVPAPAKRGISDPIALPIEVQRAFFTTADKMLRSSSIAYRLNPQYQQMMRVDADIEGVLRSLQVNLAALEWQVTSTDDDDPKCAEYADRITKIFDAMPRRSDFVRSMHEAVWYGSSAANLVYERDPRLGMRVKEWYSFHPDTLAYDQRGNLAMKVGSGYSLAGESSQNIGFDARVHIFDDRERQAIVHHKVFVNAPDFNDPNATDSIYRGVGARDVCWFMWLAKQEILQDAITYAERYAMGIRVGFYPLGQDAGREMMQTILANLANDNSVLLPQSGTEKIYDIDIKEPNAGRAQVFMELVNWFSGKIKEAIVGQSLSSEAAATGLGSGVAQLHADTLSRIVRYHADALADSLTCDFVRVVARMLGATEEQASALRFEFAPERPDPKERLEAIRQFVELGGRVAESEVRDLLGLSEPAEGERVLSLSSASSDVGGDALAGLLAPPQGSAMEGAPPSADAPREFSRKRWL